ncbi:MAG: hypothetical protein AB7U20_02545 [Planctomycetaceae bacterium]
MIPIRPGSWPARPGFSSFAQWENGAPFDAVLEECRQYLLLVANEELGDDLRAEGGASDLVREHVVGSLGHPLDSLATFPWRHMGACGLARVMGDGNHHT